MNKRKHYSAEFKQEAISLVNSSDQSASQVARDLGIRPVLLYRWRAELKGAGEKAFNGKGRPREEGMARLKRENVRLKKERDFFTRRGSVLRQGVLARYQAIDDCRHSYPVRMMCRCLRISASGYYAWCNRPLSQRVQANVVLFTRIREMHFASGGVMGAPSIWEQ